MATLDLAGGVQKLKLATSLAHSGHTAHTLGKLPFKIPTSMPMWWNLKDRFASLGLASANSEARPNLRNARYAGSCAVWS